MTEKDLTILVDWIVHRLWLWSEDDEENDGIEVIRAIQIILIPYLQQINDKMDSVSKEELLNWQDKTIDLIKNDDELSRTLKEYNLELLFETNEKGNMS